MEEQKMNLVQKLAKIRAMSDVVVKSKKGYNYSYSDISDILANITAGMKKYGVSLIPGIVPNTAEVSQNIVVNTKVSKDGKAYDQSTTEMLVRADMVFTWVNDENPEDRIDVPWFVTGSQPDPSQAFGSGLTYCTRYFLTSYFNIAQTSADVDAYRSKQKSASDKEDKMIAGEIIGLFDTKIKAFLAANPARKTEALDFVKRYVKDANYFTITDPTIASSLMGDFEEKFLN